jgi:hypothetical protein
MSTFALASVQGSHSTMSAKGQRATLQTWLGTKETTNRGARFDELLGVVRVKLTAEQCRTLASIAAAARDDVLKWGKRRLSRGSSRRRPIGLPHRGQSLSEPTHC